MGISEAPEGLQKQIEEALAYTVKGRMTANAKTCAVPVCNEDRQNPVERSVGSRWGGDELPILDQSVYVPWRRDLEGLLLGYTK